MNRISVFSRIVVGLLLATLWCFGFAQITKTPKGYVFRAKYVKGAFRSYKMTSTITQAGASYAIAAPFTMSVLSVHKGIAKIRYTAGPVYSGKKVMGKKDTVDATMNDLNQAVEGGGAITQFGQVTFPAKPIRVGQGWTTAVDAAAGRMPIHVDGQFKLEGIRKIGGRQVAWITATIKNSKSYPTTGYGAITLDVRDASLVSSRMSMVMTLGKANGLQQSGPPQKFKIKVVIVRK